MKVSTWSVDEVSIVPGGIVIPPVSARSGVWVCVGRYAVRVVGAVYALSCPHVLFGLCRWMQAHPASAFSWLHTNCDSAVLRRYPGLFLKAY